MPVSIRLLHGYEKMWPARQCLTGQNALDSLDSKKVTRQKRLGITAMAGGPARPDYIGGGGLQPFTSFVIMYHLTRFLSIDRAFFFVKYDYVP